MNKQWSSDELKLLKNLSQAFQGKRWKKISREFQIHGFHRSEYECRNKWVNYLNPEIDHREWNHVELKVLYEEYDKHKSQWALIQKALPTRTQIKIRNQFYGAIRNLVRFLIKYFKKVNSKWSLISNKIRPETLQNLYSGQKQFEFVGECVKNAIFTMEFKFDRIKFMEIIEKNQQVFRRVNELILKTLPNLTEIIQSNQEASGSKSQVEEIECIPSAKKSTSQKKNIMEGVYYNQRAFLSHPPPFQQMNPYPYAYQNPNPYMMGMPNSYTFPFQMPPATFYSNWWNQRPKQ